MPLKIIPAERIESKIHVIRNRKVMIDADLAALYQVKTKVLNQAVKRNADRFPDDFMFELTDEEATALRSRFVTSNGSRGGNRYRPFAFTEQGVAMLSSVLNSRRSIMVNIQIIRTFTELREMIAENSELRNRIDALEQGHDANFKAVFDAIRRSIEEDEKPKPLIGFEVGERDKDVKR